MEKVKTLQLFLCEKFGIVQTKEVLREKSSLEPERFGLKVNISDKELIKNIDKYFGEVLEARKMGLSPHVGHLNFKTKESFVFCTITNIPEESKLLCDVEYFCC